MTHAEALMQPLFVGMHQYRFFYWPSRVRVPACQDLPIPILALNMATTLEQDSSACFPSKPSTNTELTNVLYAIHTYTTSIVVLYCSDIRTSQ